MPLLVGSYRGIVEGVGTIGSWKMVACAIHATMDPAFAHQHVPQIHLQHALHIRETHRRVCKFPDVTTNQYNQTTSPVRLLLYGESSTVGFVRRPYVTDARGTPARRTPTDRAALVRVGWSPPLHDIPPTRSSAVPSRLDDPRHLSLSTPHLHSTTPLGWHASKFWDPAGGPNTVTLGPHFPGSLRRFSHVASNSCSGLTAPAGK